MLRVVFDTNVFRPGTFDLIERSPLIAQCKARRIAPIYGPIFLEEVIATYGITGKRKHLINRWLPFIEMTASRIPDELPQIFHRELVEGKGHKADFRMRPKVQEYMFSQLRNAREAGEWDIWESTGHERDVARKKRKATHDIVSSMRAEFGQRRKLATQQELSGPMPTFAEYEAANIDHMGRTFMPRLIPSKNISAIADIWSRYKANYPFYTGYIRNMLYLCYYAMTKQNDRIDQNGAADLELLLHLIHGDAVVSDEKGFLKTAFNDLWRPRRKILFSVNEFIRLVE